MSFKNFSTAQNDPAKMNPAEKAKDAPVADQPPAPSETVPAPAPADKT